MLLGHHPTTAPLLHAQVRRGFLHLEGGGVVLGHRAVIALLNTDPPCPKHGPITSEYCSMVILAERAARRVERSVSVPVPGLWRRERRPVVCIGLPGFTRRGVPYASTHIQLGGWHGWHVGIRPYCS